MSELFTIVGAKGFIGSALMQILPAQGYRVQAWTDEPSTAPGHIIFAAGVTADFRQRPHDTMQSHVSLASEILRRRGFASFTYLSSARLYRHATSTREDAAFTLCPHDPECLYDFSKLCGESLCLNDPQESVRVVRLSNVAGADREGNNFISYLIHEALAKGEISLHTAPASAKDYVLLDDVTSMLPRIALSGREHLYNLASGRVTSNDFIVKTLEETTGCRASYADYAPIAQQPAINISRLAEEFGYTPTRIEDQLERIISDIQLALHG